MGLFWTGVGLSGTGIAIEMFSFMQSNNTGVITGLVMAVVGIVLLLYRTGRV